MDQKPTISELAKKISEDPNEVPSNHFDDTEDEYIDEKGRLAAYFATEDWGNFMVSYLNASKHTPEEFTQNEVFPGEHPAGADFPGGSAQWQQEAHWVPINKRGEGGYFIYRHPRFSELPVAWREWLEGFVYFNNRNDHRSSWKLEFDE